jgi:hypothetical protein
VVRGSTGSGGQRSLSLAYLWCRRVGQTERVPEVPQVRYAKTRDGMHIAYEVLGEGPLDLLVFSMALIPIDMVDDEQSSR